MPPSKTRRIDRGSPRFLSGSQEDDCSDSGTNGFALQKAIHAETPPCVSSENDAIASHDFEDLNGCQVVFEKPYGKDAIESEAEDAARCCRELVSILKDEIDRKNKIIR